MFIPYPALDSVPSPEAISAAIKEENLIGAGVNAQVYRFPDDQRFVVRVEGHGPPGPAEWMEDDFQGRNFGQGIVQYGPHVRLLHFQPGLVCGIPSFLQARGQQEKDAYYESTTKLAASLPLSSYTQFLKEMAFLDSINRGIDSKPDNMLIDSAALRINLVDILPRDEQKVYRNTAAISISMLFGNRYAGQYRGTHGAELVKDRRIILDHMIEAAERLNVPFHEGDISQNLILRRSLGLAGYEQGTSEYDVLVRRLNASASPELRRADGQAWQDVIFRPGTGFVDRLK